MNRKLTLYIALVVVLAGLLIYIDSTKPEPINWKPTYAVKDKIPFGLYVFNKEAPSLFKGDTIERFIRTPYEFFDAKYNYDANNYNTSGTFIAISEENTIDPESVTELLHFADYGNTVFLSMKNFPPALLDTLNLRVKTHAFFKDSVQLSIAKYPSKKQWFNEGIGLICFDSISPDSIKAGRIKVLGYQEAKNTAEPNFVEAPFGSGRIILHTQPAAFSNFHLLKGNHYEYAQGILSQLPKGTIFWQTGSISEGVSSSPLRYIISQPALKWALWLTLMGVVVFVFFNARRKQRIIPVANPVRNTTVDFARTIGNLYYMEGNHHTIIEKKIIYFLEHVRTEYLIDTYALDDDFAEKLHLKTGKPLHDIQKALSLIKKHRHNFESTEADATAINNAIENLRP